VKDVNSQSATGLNLHQVCSNCTEVKDVDSQSATGLNLHQVCSNRTGGEFCLIGIAGRDVVFSCTAVGSTIVDEP
jgi:hypothetical protein